MSKKYLTREATAEEARSKKPLREPNPSPLPSPMPPLPPTVPPVTGGGPMLSRPKETPSVRRVNKAFEQVSTALQKYRFACEENGNPLRSVTYRVEDNGCSKLHSTFRRVAR